jgi:cob(I)alamin adenosyltransferase
MVRLDRIYTRGGDGGETSLVDGSRVAKDDLRIIAMGAVDELNAVLGVARCHLAEGAGRPAAIADADAMLGRIQNELFDLGADIATPDEGRKSEGALRVTSDQVARLEREIDAMGEALAPLTSFILPGGAMAAAATHLARTVTRRAEQATISLARRDSINPAARHYLNRLSDHLFVLARALNDNGSADVLWRPGATRNNKSG